MARLILKRYRVEGELVAETPIHVGGVSQSVILDMPLAMDGTGRWYLPGTSLAGPIRRWLKRCNPRLDDEALWGFTPGRGEATREGQASYITMEDAPLVGNDAVAEVRDGVGIDRQSGAAASGIKYDRELLPSGACFRFAMTVDVPAPFKPRPPIPGEPQKELPRAVDDATVRDSIVAVVSALHSGRIRFGAGKTRGLGRLRLEKTAITESDLATKAGILVALKRGPQASDLVDELKKVSKAEPLDGEIEIDLHWRAALPVMTKSDVEGIAVDALPLVTQRRQNVVPVITGASVKGVLRAHAERLCRTIRGRAEAKWDQKFLDALADEELVEALFGAPGKGKDADERYEKSSVAPGLGALAVDDCLIDRPISREKWRALTAVAAKDLKEQAVRQELGGSSWKEFRPSTHVAIDRWTGGAADTLLFSGLEPDTEGAQVFRLTLDLDRIAPRRGAEGSETIAISIEGYRRAAVALLLVTLRDVVRGKVPFGFGATRGFGSIEVERIVLRGAAGGLAEAAGLAGELTLTPADFGQNPSDDAKRVFERLQPHWTTYWELRRKEAA